MKERKTKAQPMMTSNELAAWVKVSENTPLNWRKHGTGPKFVRVGPRAIRYLRSDVLQWLAEAGK